MQVQNRELRQQTIQAINNSEARHQAFAGWVKTHLGKRGASSRYISAGLVSTEIAEKVTALSDGKTFVEQVLVIRERDFTHANSPKNQQKGTALSQQQYTTLPKIISEPLVVVWDKKHQNLIYVDQDKTIKVVAELSPKKAKFQPKEKLDTVINTYKLDFDDFVGKIKLGDYIVVKGKIEKG